MKTFEQFLEEAELDQNPERTKQINNVKYRIRDGRVNTRFRVSIHPSLADLLSDILQHNKYQFERENNSFMLDARSTDTGKKIQELMFAELNTAFIDNNKTLIKFVGSTEIGDFIDTDFSLNVDALR